MTFAYVSTLYFSHILSANPLLSPSLQLVSLVCVHVPVHVSTCVSPSEFR